MFPGSTAAPRQVRLRSPSPCLECGGLSGGRSSRLTFSKTWRSPALARGSGRTLGETVMRVLGTVLGAGRHSTRPGAVPAGTWAWDRWPHGAGTHRRSHQGGRNAIPEGPPSRLLPTILRDDKSGRCQAEAVARSQTDPAGACGLFKVEHMPVKASIALQEARTTAPHGRYSTGADHRFQGILERRKKVTYCNLWHVVSC